MTQDEEKRLAVAHRVETFGADQGGRGGGVPRDQGHGGDHPRDRLTLTPLVLNAAVEVIFVVAGPDKADALHAVIDGPREVDRTPSQVIQPTRGSLRFFVDAAAANSLAPREG